MKKTQKCILMLLVLSMVLTLSSCAGRSATVSAPEATATVAPTQAPTDNAQSVPKSLVAYFSWSGNTDQMAQWIAEESGADIYRVTPAQAYGTDFDTCADRARDELDNGIRPALADLMDAETMAQYDTIYIGFPIWWYDLPMPMLAFVENYDLSGKTIIPFFSHNGSSSGASSLTTLAEACPNTTVLTDAALSISGNSVADSEAQIREWVRNLNP